MKNRNDKVFKGKNEYPQEILQIANIEGDLQTDAQKSDNCFLQRCDTVIPNYCGRINGVFFDGAWKEHDKFSGQRWFCKKEGSSEKMMRAMNIRRSLSPLHDEWKL